VSHLRGRAALTEGFIITSAPVGCREIHAAARLGQWAKGRVMVRFSRRATQATRGKLVPAASCIDKKGPKIGVVLKHLKLMRGRSYGGEG
jgi:hypothetical protein